MLGNANICVGVGYTFTNTSADPGVWASDNTAVATVDNTGFVKGVTVGTANITYTITNATTHCSNSTSFAVNVAALPTITLGNIPAICSGSTTASLPYTAVSSGSLKYDIIWNTTSLTNVSGVDLTASPIQLSIPANAPAGTYTGTFSIRNTTSSCTSSYAISITINPTPTITLVTNPNVCKGITNATLTYTSTNNPVSYSINWDTTAITDGFTNVSTDTPLPSSTINIVVPATANATSYTGTITVKNANGCISPPVSFSMVIHPKPPLPQVNITSN
nr:Ig-like domain-containing protein [Pedobacter sp. ASV19]